MPIYDTELFGTFDVKAIVNHYTLHNMTVGTSKYKITSQFHFLIFLELVFTMFRNKNKVIFNDQFIWATGYWG